MLSMERKAEPDGTLEIVKRNQKKGENSNPGQDTLHKRRAINPLPPPPRHETRRESKGKKGPSAGAL